MSPLPPYISLAEVRTRLLAVFPEGSPGRRDCTRDIAGATVFVMLYIGAVEGTGRVAAPRHVYRMSDEQALLTSDAERLAYAEAAHRTGLVSRGKPWYADNSREAIRDEVLRRGLIPAGAVMIDRSVQTTAQIGRYALARDFAALFEPGLDVASLESVVRTWRSSHLTPAALARVELLRSGVTRHSADVLVELPNREVRRLAPGSSSIITRAVIEEFAHRFLHQPAVLWLSESRRKVILRDDDLARRVGLEIDPARNLPDLILADVGPVEALLVFVEVVATDGAISEERRAELLAIARDGGFDDHHVAFVTAFLDRQNPVARKLFASLAWNSFAWFASEPERLVAFVGNAELDRPKLHEILLAARSTS